MPSNPVNPPSTPNPISEPPVYPKEPTKNTTSVRETYHIVSDTVVGMNIRKSDNLFQLKVILVCCFSGCLIGAIVGAILSDSNHRLSGVIGGGIGLGFVGVILGLFGSGIYLMIYRAVRHWKGEHLE